MDAVRTVVCKLAPTPAQRVEVEATLVAFAQTCDAFANVARDIGSTNRFKVHHAGYYQMRERFGLSANLVVRAIARACAALKVPEKMHSKFEATSIDYDARIFSFREWDWTFGLTLLHSRQRIKTHLGDRQRAMLRGRKPTSAVLVKRRDGALFLHVQLIDQAPAPMDTYDVIGVDLGIKHLAVTDDGTAFSGAKRLVARATGTASAIALEDLDGIAKRTTARKPDRSRLKGWAFFQLRQFVTYKALAAGIPLILVDPAYTSQRCSRCGYTARNNRRTRDAFECHHCGFALPADWNAALNIRARACVDGPNVGAVDAGPRNPAEATYKPLALAGGS